MNVVLFVLALVTAPLVVDLRQWVRAAASDRVGRPLGSAWNEILRHARARPPRVLGETPVGPAGCYLALVSEALALVLIPGIGPGVPSFPGDVVVLLYLLGIARLGEILAAADLAGWTTMLGVRRLAFGQLAVEPTLALVLGGLAVAHRRTTLEGLFATPVPESAVAPVLLLALSLGGLTLLAAGGFPGEDAAGPHELASAELAMGAERAGPPLAALRYAAALRLLLHGALTGAVVGALRPSLQLPAILAAILLFTVAAGLFDAHYPRQRPGRAIGLPSVSALLAGIGVAILLARGGG